MAEDMWVRVQIFIGHEPFSISEKKHVKNPKALQIIKKKPK